MASLASGTLWVAAVLLIFSHEAATVVGDGCKDIKVSLARMGISPKIVPEDYIPGDHLEVCQGRRDLVSSIRAPATTCCTQDMEQLLTTKAKAAFDIQYVAASDTLKGIFAMQFRAFDSFFTDLIEENHKELDDMFKTAYGTKYTQNKGLFDQFFADLSAYYRGNDLNLQQEVKVFFEKIFIRMYEMLNPHLEVSDKYKNCITSSLEVIKPFGDIPEKIGNSIQQAFVAARTLVQAIDVGKNVAVKLEKMTVTENCRKGLMSMLHCPFCHGHTQVKPCRDLCLNTVRGCVAYHSDLDAQWGEYLDYLYKLASRLEGEGAFNLEAVIAPLKDDISSAIMQYQNNKDKVSDLVEGECGVSRRRRFISAPQVSEQKSHSPLHFRARRRAAEPPRPELYDQVAEFKRKVRTLKGYWVNLPRKLCTGHMSARAKETSQCWNGERTGPYLETEMGNGVTANLNNPEVPVSRTDLEPSEVAEARKTLQTMAQRLKDSLQGNHVPWYNINGQNSPSEPGVDIVLPNFPSETPDQGPGPHSGKPFGGGGDSLEGSGGFRLPKPSGGGGRLSFVDYEGSGSGDRSFINIIKELGSGEGSGPDPVPPVWGRVPTTTPQASTTADDTSDIVLIGGVVPFKTTTTETTTDDGATTTSGAQTTKTATTAARVNSTSASPIVAVTSSQSPPVRPPTPGPVPPGPEVTDKPPIVVTVDGGSGGSAGQTGAGSFAGVSYSLLLASLAAVWLRWN